MVFREQAVNRMEGKRVPIVDTWKTYVSWMTDERPELIVYWSQSGGGQKHASVCDFFMVLFEGVYNAH